MADGRKQHTGAAMEEVRIPAWDMFAIAKYVTRYIRKQISENTMMYMSAKNVATFSGSILILENKTTLMKLSCDRLSREQDFKHLL